MSLYNMVHGENPMASVFLSILGLTRREIPRYRDCWWDGEHLCILTRTGGPNRPDYDHSVLTSQPTYVRDHDEPKDNTYAVFYFALPPAMAWTIPHLRETHETPQQKWETFFDRLHNNDGRDDPQVQKVITAFQPMFEQLQKVLKGKDTQ